ncbi:uncharacterized protein LOC123292521 [Chrysoperla carnea]|uniref:uncharacterized protein LOC123292521 n=1 Tax=Chrysoperla carnea TaxID=189513 RepID=UPI001D0754A9|nr:uncharacterized protein LOC123292521 [Chrysoperla carnea]
MMLYEKNYYCRRKIITAKYYYFLNMKSIILLLFVMLVWAQHVASAPSQNQGKILRHYANQVGPAYRGGRGTVLHVQAVNKGTALLPCDLTPPTVNDSVVLIVWYKNEQTPIYRCILTFKNNET